MRLHSLRVSAFGPFATSVDVNFDELSDAGLFLLTGATGAGKSSVLDAVCFALYGQVPGDRHTARHLRCDQAPEGAAPEVVLEASIRSRRFRFTRSPQWERPKKRGTGTTRVQAHVVVEELRDAGWTALTNRLDDAGLLVTDLLGMTCAQFTQVALLPQGQFMTFLRSRSQERQDVLQRLFRTDRFEQVERWLVDRRITLRRGNQAANDEVAAVLNRLQEVAEVSAPDEWALDDLAVPAQEGEVTTWADALVDTAATAQEEAAEARAGAVRAAETARGELVAAQRTAQLRARGEEAQRAHAELDRDRPDVMDARERLAAHHRAFPVTGLARRADKAARAAEEAAARLQESLDVVGELLALPEGDVSNAIAAATETTSAALAVAESFVPRERELRRERERVRSLEARCNQDRHSLDELHAQLQQFPTRQQQARCERDALRDQAAGLAEAREFLEAAQLQVARFDQLAELAAQLQAAEEALDATAEVALERREAYLDAREARITGMAAELASGLVVGCACPVCGSAAHPSPAVPSGTAVGRAEEEQARRAHEQAEFDKQLHQHRVGDLRTAHDQLADALAGTTVQEAQAALATSHERVASAEEALAGAQRLEGELDRLESARQAAAQRSHRLEVALAQTAAARDAAADKVDELAGTLQELLEGHDAVGLDDLLERLRETSAALAGVAAALRADQLARQTVADAEAAAHDAAIAAGFADAPSAVAATLEEDQVEQLTEAVHRFDQAEQSIAATLADPEIRQALQVPAPELQQVARETQATAQARDRAVSVADAASRRHERLRQLVEELHRRVAEWTPLRAEFATVSALAAVVEGKGVDNPLRIRLSGYVLAERLRQVVDAANERLLRMTGGRYTLEHTDAKSAGDQRGGLGLVVRDSWSGRSRDPATLSGGETFVVSLALALGLADTVSHEAGGTDVDTLFIDEGFGSLDAATLDDVMDTLDTLREGGRVVGLVSHVAELRTRIPTQLEVRTSRHGSTVRPVLVSG
ncbi:MAG TPA: SMC family ATPase [Marmoricola sp.]|nr:SMC family ATPase [Marmoricola sp.]